MIKKLRNFSVFLLMTAMLFSLASCGKEEADIETVDGDPAEYAGIWYSAPGDDRAFVFHADGQYELYSVKIGNTPDMMEQGVFKPGDSIINLSEGGTVEDFAISGQVFIYSTDSISFGSIYFTKITENTDFASLETLTEIEVPMDKYLGDWENDTIVARLTISETEYELTEEYTYLVGTYIIGKDSLFLGEDQQKLTVTDDDCLMLEGMEGIFYPAGSGNAAQPAYMAYVGYWTNSEASFAFEITEEGYCAYSEIDAFSAGFSSVIFDNGEMILDIFEAEYPVTVNDDGTLTLSGIDGVFTKQ